MKKVDIYTDGACSGNPGVGGWCAILIYNGVSKTISGYNKATTNNRMELFAIIQGLAMVGTNNEELKVGKKYDDDIDDKKVAKRRKKIEQTQELPKL